jgi:hypothetical protein
MSYNEIRRSQSSNHQEETEDSALWVLPYRMEVLIKVEHEVSVLIFIQEIFGSNLGRQSIFKTVSEYCVLCIEHGHSHFKQFL